jgi:hypothetical protein
VGVAGRADADQAPGAAERWQAIARRAHGIVHTRFVEIDADDGVEAAALELSGDILGVACGVRHTRRILEAHCRSPAARKLIL